MGTDGMILKRLKAKLPGGECLIIVGTEGAPLGVTRGGFSADKLHGLAAASKDAGCCPRFQSISLVVQGWSRGKAATFADIDRQTLRD